MNPPPIPFVWNTLNQTTFSRAVRNMVSIHFFSIVLIYVLYSVCLCSCNPALVHTHSLSHNQERESDGAYRPRDAEHYEDGIHHTEFDHEAILGSVKEAEEYDQLTPEESKRRLSLLIVKMDLNGDKYIDKAELKDWILKSFINLAREEAEDRLSEIDNNGDGFVTWPEYVQDAFGVESEFQIVDSDTSDSGMLVYEEKEMFVAADVDKDGQLSLEEFAVFASPEEHPLMHPFLIGQTLREKDSNKDGKIDFTEYVGEKGASADKSWLLSEKDKFDDLDLDKDGVLSSAEINAWIIPDNEETASEEVEHLFAVSDDDQDSLLSLEEILEHYETFVGSEATQYGDSLLDDDLYDHHFGDEL